MEEIIKNTENSERSEVEILVAPSPEDLSQIGKIEETAFDWLTEEEDIANLLSKVSDLKNITTVVRNPDKNIVGYVVAVPCSDLETELLAEDPELISAPDRLYIETLALKKEYRGDLAQIRKVISVMISEAKARGYTVVVGHVPVKHFPLYARFWQAESKRTLEDWFGSGEDHLYIEISV